MSGPCRIAQSKKASEGVISAISTSSQGDVKTKDEAGRHVVCEAAELTKHHDVPSRITLIT